ncbi:MAG: rhomboid family intramembrane serine protease [Gammaproteobacteria bacterium]|nr:MAG: rhomboid family intramembrane serine protease [Gammaproteobacteria bacterium]
MPLADASRFRYAASMVTVFIAVLWIIKLADSGLSLHLLRLGIYPREADALWGILLAPLIHGSWSHLISNSFALFVLGIVLLYGYPRSALAVLLLITIGSGLGVWLFARSSYHVGASGLTHGLMFFVFVSGILRRDRLSIALSLIVFFLYGGMIWTVFPQQPGISYESHFFGALAGVIAAFLFRHTDPLPLVKKYDWEEEDEDESVGQ